ncbi:MAG: type II toxin-antitoxin system Phd/YefM family antitoxin [FCB group bacterium]|nr:type II toxin-antitoxin system Phd/YefM family antitoxin [FCB group bacterium]MBL7027254.1 type II toxin-antitoxin system Phd/YefM family antitoxin [Candidatus Neomarinimicrobiota bacterium]MBL7122224.1 type II toxin-antitoxin system Phd/YefM family antitoxin [Candidatus Neomarinimicrobiota bacterium]
MIEVSVNQFRANIKAYVDKALSEHSSIRVKRRAGKDFVVQSAEDWEREQETLFVLQNASLSAQIIESIESHIAGSGYSPTSEELDEIDSL